MHIKKNNYDLLNFDPDRRKEDVPQRRFLSSLLGDLQSGTPEPADAPDSIGESKPRYLKIRKALLAWLKPAPSP